MADSAWDRGPAPHAAYVRATHWVVALCLAALLLTGVEIVISHPRFYWGETGNVNTPPLFSFPIPSSRATVPTGYGYVLPDQNGWSRALHFQSAWIVVLTGAIYIAIGLRRGHFRWPFYTPMQKLVYLGVVFVLGPLALWTGLAMSPAFVSAVPAAVNLLGGHQSARTIHFFMAVLCTLFLFVHLTMVFRAGFKTHVGAMITGRVSLPKEEK
jgi:thiosulfate reductase cytochrome b subunit